MQMHGFIALGAYKADGGAPQLSWSPAIQQVKCLQQEEQRSGRVGGKVGERERELWP